MSSTSQSFYRLQRQSTYGTYDSGYGMNSSNPSGLNGWNDKSQSMGLTSGNSRFQSVLGLTANETRRNFERVILLGDDDDDDDDDNGNPDVPIINGDDDEKIPIGDAILPLLVFALAYAVWKRRRMVGGDVDSD